MRILMIGPQGSGKGTQAKLVSEHYKIPNISTGDIFRDALSKKSELGLKAESYMKKGNLVPDEIVTSMVKERVRQKDCRDGFVLDGFPRNIAQAKALDKITNIDKVFVLKLSDELALKRLANRKQCKKCKAIFGGIVAPRKKGLCDTCGGKLYQRDDDKPAAIKKRLSLYHKETEPLRDYYKKKGIVHVINANSPVEKVAADINSHLERQADMLEL